MGWSLSIPVPIKFCTLDLLLVLKTPELGVNFHFLFLSVNRKSTLETFDFYADG